jgi:zinc transport system substrate-binding protein
MALLFLLPFLHTPLALASKDASPEVISSIRPIQSLVAAVMGEHGSPHLLIPAKTSAHHYQLHPQAARHLSKAKLIFWIGPSYEQGLEKALQTLALQAQKVALIDTPHLPVLEQRSGAIWSSDDHEHHHHDHEHNHHHGPIDPHIWLNPLVSIHLVHHIAKALSLYDPKHQKDYHNNAQALEIKLQALDQHLKQQLAPFKNKGFLVFHDGFHYLEKAYSLNGQGSIIADPQIPLSAHRWIQLQEHIKKQSILCLLREPEFPSPLMNDIQKNSSLRIEEIDSLGALPPPNADIKTLYFTIMQKIGDTLVQCLSHAP